MSRKSKAKLDTGLISPGQQDAVSSTLTIFVSPFVSSTSSLVYDARVWRRSNLIRTIPDATGWRPPTAYYAFRRKRQGLPFKLINLQPTGAKPIVSVEGTARPIVGTPYGYSPIDTTYFTSANKVQAPVNLKYQAETEALVRLKEGKLELGEDLGEARSTLEMLAKLVIDLCRTLIDIKKGRWGRIAKRFGHRPYKTSAQYYLAYVYGLKPLAQEIHAISETLKGFGDKDLRLSVSRAVSQTDSPPYAASANWNWVVQYGRVDWGVHVDLHAKINSPTAQKLKQIGLDNPLSIAWELSPWSLVVDWVLPLGNFFSAMTATVGLTFVGGSWTKRVVVKATYQVSPKITTTSWDPNRSVFPVCKYDCVGVERGTYGFWPTPWPYIKDPLSSTHVLNAIAFILALRK